MSDTDEIELSGSDFSDLRQAKIRLEHPSLTAKLADLVGNQIEAGFRHLPKKWNDKVGEATETALFKALEFSIRTMGKVEVRPSHDWLHKLVVAGSGVAAGAVGFYSLVVELPFSTCVMLRSIADIARSEGHDLSLIEVKLSCLEVFALGGKTSKEDSAETGYWAVRGTLAKFIPEAVTYLTKKGSIRAGVSAIDKFVAAVASRFSAVITEEAAAKAVPIVGAVSGGAINYLFMNHFQEMARGHFVVKRLEKKYGTEVVRKAYGDLVV
ncbi:MAG TPA: EcsC family protein [Thermoleophilia bacterium]|nr:EcsC family protein [Thermoleophilia bacterium]